MKIEAVTVCLGYADFLAHTLPRNQHHFDHVVVVTGHGDRDTQRVCARHNVECRPTDVLNHRGERFAKGRGVDLGLSYLLRDEWVVHLDADVVLPPNTRTMLDGLSLDEDSIYGVDRVNCPSYEAWARFAASDAVHQHQWNWLLSPPPFQLGSRVVRTEHGFIPIGFFQLWHGRHDRRYPIRQPSAEHTDFLHALQWPADKRRLIPELVAVHLESGPAKMGANWNGRQTPPFGPQGSARVDQPSYAPGR